MTAKEYLRQYERAERKARLYREEYENETLKIDAIRSLSNNDGMPHGSNISRPTEEKALRLVDKRLRLIDAEVEAMRIRQEIFDVVMSIGGLESDVLYQRYINLDTDGRVQTWERVCEAVLYTWPTVRAAWHRGLDMIEDILNT